MLRPGSFALTALLAMLTALGPLSMDIYLPSMPDIARVLETSTAHVQLTISSFLVGFAVGQIFYGPVADRFGRRPVLLTSLAVYGVATLVCAAAQSIDTLIAARFLQSLGGSGAIVLVRAIVRDLHSGARAGRELSLQGAMMALAPVVAPMIGGVLQTAFGWRASFFLLFALAAIAIVIVARLLPETLPQCAERKLSVSSLLHDYGVVARHRGFVAYLGILTLSFAGLLAWVSAASVVLQEIYGLSAVAFGFTFALGSLGYLVGTTIATRCVLRLGLDRTIGVGVTLLAIGGLALVAIVALGISQGVWLVVAMAVYLAGLGLSMPQAMAGALTPFAERAGTASSLMGFIQQIVAAVLAAVIGGYISNSAWPLAGVVAVMGCLAFLIWALTRRRRVQEWHT